MGIKGQFSIEYLLTIGGSVFMFTAVALFFLYQADSETDSFNQAQLNSLVNVILTNVNELAGLGEGNTYTATVTFPDHIKKIEVENNNTFLITVESGGQESVVSFPTDYKIVTNIHNVAKGVKDLKMAVTSDNIIMIGTISKECNLDGICGGDELLSPELCLPDCCRNDCRFCTSGDYYFKCAATGEIQASCYNFNLCRAEDTLSLGLWTLGNGLIEGQEQCDDDNLIDSDGCNQYGEIEEGWGCVNDPPPSVCSIESGWGCAGNPLVCSAICQDGIVINPEEGCDDDNSDEGDGCSSTCIVEDGWLCTGEPSVCSQQDGWDCTGTPCTAICQDGIIIDSEEECDDDNSDEGDGCSSTCTIESGWECTYEPSAYNAICQDGIIIAGEEECDDGNLGNGDGCSSTCTIESGWGCTGEPSVCTFP